MSRRALLPPAVVARRLGEPRFVRFVKALGAYGVLDREELLRWIALHGAAIRATEPPLDDGETFDEASYAGLVEALR